MSDQSDWPIHLRDNTSYLQCSACDRKSWAGEINRPCGMPQPDGSKCDGVMEGKNDSRI